MKITSWNCSGKFRDKFKEISKLEADIYVIQECENPENFENYDYKNFADNFIWTGVAKNKGLGIFSKNNIKLKNNDWQKYCLRNFISVNVNNSFDLVGVWAGKPYIEEYYIYQSINIDKYNENTIIIGDFNSNKKWDKKHCGRSHSDVVKELKNKGLISAYHYYFNEKQGEESKNTFYLYRHEDKGYHIDHCFVASNRIKMYDVSDDKKWLSYSDHMPIILEI